MRLVFIESHYLFFISNIRFASEKIIDRHVEIIRKHNKRPIIRLSLAIFIPAYGILVHIKIHRQL